MMTPSTHALLPSSSLPVAGARVSHVASLPVLAHAGRLLAAAGALSLYDAGRLPLAVTLAFLLDGALVGGTAAVAAFLGGRGAAARAAFTAWNALGLFSAVHVAARIASAASFHAADVASLTQGAAGTAFFMLLVATLASHAAQLVRAR